MMSKVEVRVNTVEEFRNGKWTGVVYVRKG